MARQRPAPPKETSPSPVLEFLQRHPQGVVLACFFCSGATGLIYEVVWSRRLTLVFGVTVLAYSTVLAAFLGGLAAGAMVLGRVADRRTDPLRVYAVLEGAVGLICFATPSLFALVERAFVAAHPALETHLWALRLVRFGLAAAVMFVPCALMGGTLPVLSRAKVHRLGELGQGVASLYGVNTLGAVVGATAAGFFLLPTVGLKGSIHLAAVINLALALVAYALHTTQSAAPAEQPVRPEAQTSASERLDRRAYAGLLVAYGLSGAAALVYEVVWTRTLALAFGTSVYAFSGMLAVFLAGIALGSIVPGSKRLAWVDRLKSPLVWFGLVEVGIAATVTLLTPLLDRLPFVFLALFRLVGPRFWALQLGGTAVAFLVMLVPAALMGFAFPLVTRLATEHVGALGKRLSAVYAANTFGTVVGSFAAGFILIPAIGARHALAVGVALNAVVGVAYLLPRLRQQRVLAGAGLGMAVLSAVVWLVAPNWNRYALSAGAYLYAEHYAAGDADRIMREKELLYYNDALTATLSVTRVDLPQFDRPIVSLQINGKTDASTGDLSTQLLLGHLPALLHPHPRSAMVIGLASGCTLGAMECHPEVTQADCIEIEPAMADITGFFREWNRDCLADPRARLIVNDARNFVLVSQGKYDVLTSEPSNPWIAGIANLFTVEHFRLCRERMAPGAVFCQWVPIYNLAPEDFRCIVATFRSVFPEASVWIFPDLPSDAYLIATLGPLRIDVAGLVRRAAQPEVAKDLQAAGLRDVWDLLGGCALDPEVLAGIGESAALNTDDFPRLEFSSPLRLYTGRAEQTLRSVIELSAESRLAVTDSAQRPESYRSLLAGLRFGSPWRVTSETVCVYRSVEAYMARTRRPPARVLLRLACGLGAGEADLTVGRLGELLDGQGRALEPAEEPRERRQIGGHEVLLWKGAPGASAWTARWLCPVHERVYLLQARGRVAPPEQALAGLWCEH